MQFRLEATPRLHVNQFVVEMQFMFGDADGQELVEVSLKSVEELSQFLDDLDVLCSLDSGERGYSQLGYNLVGDFWRDTYQRTEDGKSYIQPPVLRRTRNRWESEKDRQEYVTSMPEWRRWFEFDCGPGEDWDAEMKKYPNHGIAEWPSHPEYLGYGPGMLQFTNVFWYDETGSKYRVIEVDEDGNDVVA